MSENKDTNKNSNNQSDKRPDSQGKHRDTFGENKKNIDDLRKGMEIPPKPKKDNDKE